MEHVKKIKEIILKHLRNSEDGFSSSNKQIEEDILPVDGSLKFDYNSKTKAKNINTSLGKSSAKNKFEPRISTLRDSRIKVLSAYSKNNGNEITSILKSIKKAKDSEFSLDENDYQQFINRTAIFFVRYLKDKNTDSIFVMESSSPLAGDIAFKIKNMLPNTSIKFLANSIIKDIASMKLERTLDDKISDEEFQSLEKIYNKAKETGEFSIKKIPAKHRKFFKNWIQINQESIGNITGKNVVIFDDYITSGATLDEVCKQVLSLSPKQLSAITLVK